MNKPDYYTEGDYEPIRVMIAWNLNFCLSNVIKYLNRAGKKEVSPIQDLKKAIHYIEIQIESNFPIAVNITGLHGKYADYRIAHEWGLSHELSCALRDVSLAISSVSKGQTHEFLREAKKHIQNEIIARAA